MFKGVLLAASVATASAFSGAALPVRANVARKPPTRFSFLWHACLGSPGSVNEFVTSYCDLDCPKPQCSNIMWCGALVRTAEMQSGVCLIKRSDLRPKVESSGESTGIPA